MIAAAILAIAIAKPQTVTFSHPCANANVVLEALGKELGLTIKPLGSVNQDYFLVSFNDLPVQEALDKIAETLHATWEDKDGVKYLNRTHTQELEEEKAERAIDVKVISEWLAKRQVTQEYDAQFARKLIEQAINLMDAKANNGPNVFENLMKLDEESPASRLLTRLLKEIGPETLADLGEFDEVVYSLDPSPLQRKLPNGEAMRLFKKENDVHKLVIDSGLAERIPVESYYSTLVSPYRDSFYDTTKTQLTVSKEMGNRFQINLDVEGVGRVYASIQLSEKGSTTLPPELSGQMGEYKPSATEAELARITMQAFGERKGVEPVTADLARLLRDPVANEPLATFGSPWMLAAAKALNKNVVALLSDDATWTAVVIAGREKPTFAQLWTFLPQMDKGYNVMVDEKWVTLAPLKPTEVRKERIDRENWRKLINARRDGSIIDLLAGYAILSDNNLLVMLATVPGILTGQSIDPELIQRDDGVDALRLYGTLNTTQMKTAHGTGFQLALAQFSPRQAKYARKIVYNSRSSIETEARADKWDDPNMFYATNQETDPTVKLGRGVPNGSVLTSFVLERDLFYPRPVEGYGRPRGSSIEDLADRVAAAQVWPENNYGGDFSYVGIAHAEQLVLEFAFPGIGVVYKRVQMDLVSKDMVYKKPSELPSEVRSKLDPLVQKKVEEYKKARGGGTGGAQG